MLMENVGKSTDHRLRVRYADTDRMGYVYYGNYARYYEIGRVEHMRDLGVSYRELEENGVMLPVAHVESKFLRPATYDQLITLRTSITALGEHDITFVTDVLNDEEKLLNRGKVRLVFVCADTRRRMEVPAELREKLQVSLT